MPKTTMVRRHTFSAPRRRALCASIALVALLGCAGGSTLGEGSPQPVGMPGEGPPPPLGEVVAGGPERLAELQDRLKVPGLEDRRFSHAELWAAIEPYIGRAVSDRVVGESAEGRSIPLLTYGSGPVPILLWSQMHGNESTATMAMAAGLSVGVSSSPHLFRFNERITLNGQPAVDEAIVQAFGLDERTVQRWHERAGEHCQALHEHVIEESRLDLQQVQADEIKVKMQGRYVWMAMALMVS